MRRLFLATALLLAAAGAVRAQPIDMSRGGPVEVTASQGMEWRQNEQMVVARGDARAVRGDVTVTADTLIARYRRKAGSPDAAPPPPGTPAGAVDTGNNEIYRLEAEGNVHIYTATDQAWADHATYDIDKAVLVLTGHDLKITTPQQVMLARDAMEYWTQLHMAVGRGAASVTTLDGRRLSADTIVGYTANPNAPGTPAPAKPIQPAAAKSPSDPVAASGKLQKVEAFGNVEVRTATETLRGDRAVYVPDSQVARVVGHVHVTRGQTQLNGDEALINMRTGVSEMLRNPGSRVQGLVVPNDPTLNHGQGASPTAPSTAPSPTARPARR